MSQTESHKDNAVRLSKRLAEQLQCSRREAALYIENGAVQVDGITVEHPGARLCNGTAIEGKQLPRIKVSWQSEQRLRFALKGIAPHEIDAMCRGVGLKLVGLKRLRVGRISMAGLTEGQWRYLMPWERF